jgi:hypothetical protein
MDGWWYPIGLCGRSAQGLPSHPRVDQVAMLLLLGGMGSDVEPRLARIGPGLDRSIYICGYARST